MPELCADILLILVCLISACLISADIFAESFPESEYTAKKKVAKAQELRGEPGSEWNIEDLVTSLLT